MAEVQSASIIIIIMIFRRWINSRDSATLGTVNKRSYELTDSDIFGRVERAPTLSEINLDQYSESNEHSDALLSSDYTRAN